MNKKFKKICSMVLTLAITATSAVSMSVSAYDIKISHLTDYTVIDDKGMMNDYTYKDNKIIYDNQYDELIIADSNPRVAQFVLSEDVNYEEANERVIEIFKEFYPDNYLGVDGDYYNYEEAMNYSKNYKPNLWSNTANGVTTYTLCAMDRQWPGIEEEKIAEVKKYSKAFMEKLNEEKLISAFYDFGEKYYPSAICSGHFRVAYSSYVDIDLIENYIKENNIDCSIKKIDFEYSDGYWYKLEFNEDTTRLEQFLTAVDIYDATAIEPEYFEIPEILRAEIIYGKNAIEDLKEEPTEPATEPTEATTEPTTTEATTTTTEQTTEVTTTTTTNITGDANGDNKLDIRDAAFIAQKLAKRIVEVNTEYKLESKTDELPEWADYNKDGSCDIRDAAAIARDLASKKIR